MDELTDRGIAALAELMAMEEANHEREEQGKSHAYGEERFQEIADRLHTPNPTEGKPIRLKEPEKAAGNDVILGPGTRGIVANVVPEKCPECGEPEISASTPRTVYCCGSSDYDQRPGTFIQSPECTGQKPEDTGRGRAFDLALESVEDTGTSFIEAAEIIWDAAKADTEEEVRRLGSIIKIASEVLWRGYSIEPDSDIGESIVFAAEAIESRRDEVKG